MYLIILSLGSKITMNSELFDNLNFLNGNPLKVIANKKNISLFRYITTYIVIALFFFGIAVLLVEMDQGKMMRNSLIERSFYKDYNYISFLLLTIPGLTILILRLRWLITKSLSELIKSKILKLKPTAKSLIQKWNKICLRNNIIAIVFAMLFLSITFPITIKTISEDPLMCFQTRGTGSFVIPGYWFLISTFILSILLVTIITLILNQIFFLKELIKKHSYIEIQVLHPDKLGGLSPITDIGYAYQHVLALVGVNISIMIYTWFFVGVTGEVQVLIGYSIFLCILYIILTPVLFLAPLVMFRQNILKIKSYTLIKIGNQYNNQIKKYLKPKEIDISPAEVSSLNNLKYLYNEVDKLPEWPFDWGTLKKLSLTFISPIIPIIITWFVKTLLKI